MSSDRNNLIQSFIIIILILYVTGLLLWFLKTKTEKDKKSERLRRLSQLKKERHILLSHKQKTINLENKIQEASDLYWRRIVQSLLIFLFILIAPLFIWFLDISYIEKTMSYYSIGHLLVCVIVFIFTLKTFSMKDIIYHKINAISYKKIAGHRDAEYFAEKHETIEDRLEQVELEIKQLSR